MGDPSRVRVTGPLSGFTVGFAVELAGWVISRTRRLISYG